MNSSNTLNATSSQESEDGLLPFALQGGQMKDPYGRLHAHANLSASELLTKRKEQAMTAIFGQLFSNSKKSTDLQQSLENKLKTRFLGAGLTVPKWIVKTKATPLRQRYCELTLSERYTKGKGSIGWQTPAARDGKDVSRGESYLAARKRNTASMATQLLNQGVPWLVIGQIYSLAMGFPSKWFEMRLKASETQSCRKSRPNLSARG